MDGVAWTYDQRGNLLSNGKYNLEWDVASRLTAVKKVSDGSTVASYQYDHLGRRIVQEAGSIKTTFLYDGASNRVVAEFINGVLSKTYIWSPTGQLLNLTNYANGTGTTYYTVTNKRGDIVALTDASGDIVESETYVYDAWGNHDPSSSQSTLNPYRYAGYRYDALTGLYYLNARYYDPLTGRFLSPDPLTKTMEYEYSENNPVAFVDPTGLRQESGDLGPAGGNTQAGYAWARLLNGAATYIVAGVLISRGNIKGAVNFVVKDSIRNPNGRKGGPEHRAKVDELKEEIKTIGLKPQTEYHYKLPEGSKFVRRFADVVGLDEYGQVKVIYQVGKQTKSGVPIKREADAINDIKRAEKYNGAPIHFVPYN